MIRIFKGKQETLWLLFGLLCVIFIFLLMAGGGGTPSGVNSLRAEETARSSEYDIVIKLIEKEVTVKGVKKDLIFYILIDRKTQKSVPANNLDFKKLADAFFDSNDPDIPFIRVIMGDTGTCDKEYITKTILDLLPKGSSVQIVEKNEDSKRKECSMIFSQIVTLKKNLETIEKLNTISELDKLKQMNTLLDQQLLLKKQYEDLDCKRFEKNPPTGGGASVSSVGGGPAPVINPPTPQVSTVKTYLLDISKPFNNSSDVTSMWKLAHDPNPHEATHGINALIRIKYPTLKGTGIHLGFDKNGNAIFTPLIEPRGSIKDIVNSEYIPSFFKNPPGIQNRYKTYLLNTDWNNITYLFDEWSAYINGGEARLKMLGEGKKTDPSGTQLLLSNIIEGPADYMVIGGFVALYLKNKDSSYFDNNEFKMFLKLMFERSARLIDDGLKNRNISDAGHTKYILDHFRTDPEFFSARQLLVELYGVEWTNRILGF